MILFPNAKINIGLNIESKRNDGYHNISSVFYPIPLFDVLEFKKDEKFLLKVWGNKIQSDAESNLVSRAYRLLKKEFGIPPVKVHLLKNIPIGSGLGGGSSDAAFMLKGLNDYFTLGLTDYELLGFASEICSDCPFFIKNKPAFVTGRGDKIENIDLNLERYYLLLVFPEVAVSTKDAYSKINPSKKEKEIKEIVLSGDFSLWRKYLVNDFESVLPQELIDIKKSLYESGALFASMTGSGSAFYGIFSEKPQKLNNYKSIVLRL